MFIKDYTPEDANVLSLISINASTLPSSVSYTVIYMVRMGVRVGLGLV